MSFFFSPDIKSMPINSFLQSQLYIKFRRTLLVDFGILYIICEVISNFVSVLLGAYDGPVSVDVKEKYKSGFLYGLVTCNHHCHGKKTRFPFLIHTFYTIFQFAFTQVELYIFGESGETTDCQYLLSAIYTYSH